MRRTARPRTRSAKRPRRESRPAQASPEDWARALLDRAYRQVRALLAAEKRRRGVAPDRLLFVGMHNIAQYKWCAMYAVLKSRANERDFFLAHLEDRIEATLALGRPLPPKATKPADLLTTGLDIRWEDLPPPKAGKVRTMHFDGGVTLTDVAAAKDGRPPANAMARGAWAEGLFAKSLPSTRWSFEWGPYVAVGIPDGIGKDFVYEFKSTLNAYMLNFTRPVALAQADLYGYFFDKPRKRVDFHVQREERVEHIEKAVDRANAEDVLAKFARLDTGGYAQPPKPWKCGDCEYRHGCSLRAR
jgi:hypothetical protein